MFRKIFPLSLTFAFAFTAASAADKMPTHATLTAAEIADKNVEARGGLQAWRAVQTLQMEGKLGAGGSQRPGLPQAPPGKKLATIPTDPRPKDEVQLPFALKLERPRKSRFELLFNGQTALQVFDGTNGWKLRPYLNRREIEPYSTAELSAASMQADLDGPLVDYEQKGTRVELDGMDKVEDRDTYKLKLTLKNGQPFHVWVDAQTFLEAKIEAQPRQLDGILHPVEVFYRDYRPVSGLQIPFILETRVLPLANLPKGRQGAPVQIEKIAIDKVEVNPRFDANLFSKPVVEAASNRK